jgi:hypothetical protein
MISRENHFLKLFLVLSLSPKRKASLEYKEHWNDFESVSRNVYYSLYSKLDLGQIKNQNWHTEWLVGANPC